MNIWQKLKKPILALAPMEDVTDTVFRRIVSACARPDVFFTEFTNVDGMQSAGRDAINHRFSFTKEEHPIVAQVWGMKPENYEKTARELVEMGFDGVDINMGCPVGAVIGHGACAALINTPSLAKEIILATQKGAGGRIPVSVKTRIGYKNISEDWIPFLLEQNLDALTIHGRTAAEMSKAPVHWDQIQKAVQMRDAMKLSTVIIGNGDVKNAHEALEKAKEYQVDGIMMGRAVFEDLWAFERGSKHEPTVGEHLAIMKKHVELYEKTWGTKQHFPILRKFFKIYVKGFEGASEWREKVMATKSAAEVYPMIDEMMVKYGDG